MPSMVLEVFYTTCKNTPASAKDTQKTSIEQNYPCSDVVCCSHKKSELELKAGCRQKGFDHVLFQVLQCLKLRFTSPEGKEQAMINEVIQ